MNSKVIVGLIVLLAGVGAGWYFLQGVKNTSTNPKTKSPNTLGTEPTATGSTGKATEKVWVPSSNTAQASVTVTYDDNGFSPNTVTVKKGTTVVWTNQNQGGMWVASAVHPTHQLLPGFDQLKSVRARGTYEYSFTKVGTWKYHNHVQPSDTGTIVVTE